MYTPQVQPRWGWDSRRFGCRGLAPTIIVVEALWAFVEGQIESSRKYI